MQEIIDAWRAQDPPGRFLTRTDPASRERSLWRDVGDEAAFKKTVKVLGEGLGVKRKSNRDVTQHGPKRQQHRGGDTGTAQAASLQGGTVMMSATGGSEQSPSFTYFGAGHGSNGRAIHPNPQPSSAPAMNYPGTSSTGQTSATITTGLHSTNISIHPDATGSSTQARHYFQVQPPSQQSREDSNVSALPVAASLTKVFNGSSSSVSSESADDDQPTNTRPED